MQVNVCALKGALIRHALRHGSHPAIVLQRINPEWILIWDEVRTRTMEIPDADVVYLEGELTGNQNDDE